MVGLLAWGASGAQAGDGVVALQTAAPSCANDSGDRYVDCGNGTVTDNDTGLVWLQRANCLAKCSFNEQPCVFDGDCPPGETCDPTGVDWFTATEFVAGLSDKPATSIGAEHDCGLSDGSSPGEWRLPSIEEWEAMAADATPFCSPTITTNSGAGCWSLDCVIAGACSFFGVAPHGYWTSTSDATGPADSVFLIELGGGTTGFVTKQGPSWYVWPVRGGQ